MLHFFRRHKGALMIVLTVIIIISFSVWGGYTGNQRSSGSPSDRAFEMYGRTYNAGEMGRNQRFFQLSQMLGLYQFGMELVMASYQFQTRDQIPVDFTFNLVVLKKQMEELGIHVSDAEALETLQNLPVFQNDNKFDPARAQMVEERLGAMGFQSPDMLTLVKYDIGFRKLKDLVTNNYVSSKIAAEKRYASLYQTIKASTVSFSLADFKEKVTVTDEEIAKVFEEKKDQFKTPEMRSVKWVFFAEPEGLDKIEDEAEKNKKRAEFTGTVRQFAQRTGEPGAKLEALAAEAELKIETSPAFAEDALPEPLSKATGLASDVWLLDADAVTITTPHKSDDGYFIAELNTIEAPRPQELSEVTDRIRETLIDQKSREAMAEKVNTVRDALVAALKEGKELESLKEELNLTIADAPEFSPNSPPAEFPNAYEIAKEAEGLAPGSVSKAVTIEGGVILVVVKDKELRKRPEGDSTRSNVETSLTDLERNQIFNAWFARQKEAAKLKPYFQFS